MKIGIYGGTFDPPHIGHMRAAKEAMTTLELDKLLLIPAACPPHKSQPPDGASPHHRLEMTRLMGDGIALELGCPQSVETLDMEIQRQGVSYTLDTLKELKQQYPQDQLLFLMGSDMLESFSSWHKPQEIGALATIVAFARNYDEKTYLTQLAMDLKSHVPVEILALAEVTPLSSTQVREELSQGGGMDDVWCQVYGYILRHQLYGTQKDLKDLTIPELQRVSWSMVRAKRIPHIQGCEEECCRLAERWGVDPHIAQRAGILHDCTKYLSLKEHLELCDRYQIELDTLERNTVKLLHAKSGGGLAKHLFGQPDVICQAIDCHTTGKADMDMLAKILYVADYMEPNRADFEGLDTLRILAYQDIDKALLFGCEMTISDMEERGMEIHKNTRGARDALKGSRS